MGVAGDEVSADALWYVGPGRAEIREERLKPLASGKVRVRALYGAISRGTEALIAAGIDVSGEQLEILMGELLELNNTVKGLADSFSVESV